MCIFSRKTVTMTIGFALDSLHGQIHPNQLSMLWFILTADTGPETDSVQSTYLFILTGTENEWGQLTQKGWPIISSFTFYPSGPFCYVKATVTMGKAYRVERSHKWTIKVELLMGTRAKHCRGSRSTRHAGSVTLTLMDNKNPLGSQSHRKMVEPPMGCTEP